ncbi:MAG: HDOD domain-containing protein [Planctomycetes bacterium]|nr:HDOD domain-containing protein [Planctomycetota bacterium]
MSESVLQKSLKALSVMGSIDGRVPAGAAADYRDGVLVLDTPAPYPDDAYVEIFLGKPDARRGVEILGRAHSQRGLLAIHPILQVDTVSDTGSLRSGVLPRLPDELLDPEALFDRVRRLKQLPTLPAVVARILELSLNEETTAADLSRVISQDPVLSAELLRLANSAYYGLEQQVSAIDRVVVILGFNHVRMAALTISVLRMWARESRKSAASGLPDVFFDENAFWQHCLGVAVASDAVARGLGSYAGENAFVAGLFHDIGRIVLSQYLSPMFSRALILAASSPGTTLHSAEVSSSGLGHERIGEWLTASWNLPLFIRSAIEKHHMPEISDRDDPAPLIVHLADVLTNALGLCPGAGNCTPALHATALERLGVDESVLESIVYRFYRGISNSRIFFSMMVGKSVPEPIKVLIAGGGRNASSVKLAESILSRKMEKDSPGLRTLLKIMVQVLAAGGWAEEQ